MVIHAYTIITHDTCSIRWGERTHHLSLSLSLSHIIILPCTAYMIYGVYDIICGVYDTLSYMQIRRMWYIIIHTYTAYVINHHTCIYGVYDTLSYIHIRRSSNNAYLNYITGKLYLYILHCYVNCNDWVNYIIHIKKVESKLWLIDWLIHIKMPCKIYDEDAHPEESWGAPHSRRPTW